MIHAFRNAVTCLSSMTTMTSWNL